MVTVRTYVNQAEAALAESLLENYEIDCAIIHDCSHLYAPYAVPIRLQVAEAHAQRAIRILNGDLDAAEDEVAEGSGDEASTAGTPGNPWELLFISLYLLLPAICFLQTSYPSAFETGSRARRGVAAISIFHFLGWLGVLAGLALVALYAWVVWSRKAARRSS